MNSDNVSLPLADAQMLLAWMDETFGNEDGTDWHDEDAGAVAEALNKAIENFKAMRAAIAPGNSWHLFEGGKCIGCGEPHPQSDRMDGQGEQRNG